MSNLPAVQEKDCFQTPSDLLDLVRLVAPIDLDPCTTPQNPVGATRFFTEETNGLTSPWLGDGLVFCNPPYGRGLISAWAEKLASEIERTGMRREYIALLPARTDTQWWFRLIRTRPVRVCFVEGRVTFNKPDGTPSDGPGKFPSAVLYWGCDPVAFTRAFCERGWIVRG